MRRSILIALTSVLAACGPSQASVPSGAFLRLGDRAAPAPGLADPRLTAEAPRAAGVFGKKPVFAFKPYAELPAPEQRLLEASAIALDPGGPEFSGQRLYGGLAQARPELLATFLNQAAVLATVELAPGRKALDYLTRIEALGVNHVYADADPKMAQDIAVRASKRWQDRTQYLGPEDSSMLHGKYDTSYRENRAYTSMQLCFSRKDDLRKVDIDVDEECPLAGDKIALAKHLARALQHEVLRKIPGKQRGESTQPDDIFRRLSRSPLKPDGRPDKIGRGIQPSFTLGPAAPAADAELGDAP